MNIHHVLKQKGPFHILETTPLSQQAVMILQPGESSDEKLNTHPVSDQVLLVVKGSLTGLTTEEEIEIRSGESLVIHAGQPHRFINRGTKRAIAFTVYSPPAY